MAINFPSSPTQGTSHTDGNGVEWIYDGTSWVAQEEVDDTPVDGNTGIPISSNWAFDLVNTTLPTYLLKANIDDTPVDGVTDAPISSNWAYDLLNSAQTINGSTWNFTGGTVSVTGGAFSLYRVGDTADADLLISRDVGYEANISYRTGAVDRWKVGVNSSAESGSDAGTNFEIARYNDAGTFQDTPFWISRATGNAVFEDELICNDDLTVSRNTQATHARIHLTRDAGSYGQIYFETVESKRWEMGINNTAEAGSDAGSDFYIGRANDSGVWQDNPIVIDRATGNITGSNQIKAPIIATGGYFIVDKIGASENALLYLSADSDQASGVYLRTGTSLRWSVQHTTTDETGSDVGSDFAIARFNDSGAYQDIPLLINRASGDVDIANDLQVGGSPVVTNSSGDTRYQPYGAVCGVNNQTGTTYTLVAGDAGDMVECNNAAAITLTVPNAVFSAGDIIQVMQLGAGQVTIAAGASTTLYKPATFNAKSLEQYAIVTIYFRSASVFVLGGGLEVA